MYKIHIGMNFKNTHDDIFCTQLLNEKGKSIADYSIIQTMGIPQIRHIDSLSKEEIENFINESKRLYNQARA